MTIGTGEAILASTGANILAGAFGGNGSGTANLNMRRERKQRRGLYELAREDWRTRTAESYKNQVAAAKAAGLHPLFAMGAGSGPGQSPSFSMPGQAPTGSFAKEGLLSIGAGFRDIAQTQAKADLIDKMNESERIAQAGREGSNDSFWASYREALTKKKSRPDPGNPPGAEPPKISQFNPAQREQNRNVISPMTKMRLGTQDIWIPMEELESFMEDPLAPSVAVLTYHGNKNVDWATVQQDWTKGGWKNLSPRDATRGTKQMMMRSTREKRNKYRRRHGYKQSSAGRPKPRPLSRR